jgi:hypothetical protein
MHRLHYVIVQVCITHENNKLTVYKY